MARAEEFIKEKAKAGAARAFVWASSQWQTSRFYASPRKFNAPYVVNRWGW